MGKISIGINEIRMLGDRMVSILGLASSPVGVRILSEGKEKPVEVDPLNRHRYCQALMKARHGQEVLLDGGGISCPAAAAAFGFRTLTPALQSGKGLVGFGIVSREEVGLRMFADMPHLRPGEIESIHLYPLVKARYIPDIVVVEDEVERLMWIVLSSLHATGGQRVLSHTAVLQAACVDSTIVPYLEGRLNFSYGCYGCREATDIGASETVLGFPASMLPSIVGHLEFLGKKAIPTSRSKKAWADIRKEEETKPS